MKNNFFYLVPLLAIFMFTPAAIADHCHDTTSDSSHKAVSGEEHSGCVKVGCCWVAAHFPNDKETMRKHMKGDGVGCCWAPGHEVENWGKHNCSFCNQGLHAKGWHDSQKGRTSYCCGPDDTHHWSWHIHAMSDKSNCDLCKNKKHGKSWHDSLDWKCEKWGWQEDGMFHCCWDQHKLWDPKECDLCKNKVHEPSWHKSLNMHCNRIGPYKDKSAKTEGAGWSHSKGKSDGHKCGGKCCCK